MSVKYFHTNFLKFLKILVHNVDGSIAAKSCNEIISGHDIAQKPLKSATTFVAKLPMERCLEVKPM